MRQLEDGNFVLKGNLLYSNPDKSLVYLEQAYLVCIKHMVKGVFQQLPEQYQNLVIIDEGDRIIIPGMVDLHVHAPQYSFRGLGMDLELLEWLNVNTFPEEARYQDLEYAKSAYSIFVDDLKRSVTTRASIFATIHKNSTLCLMDLLEESGLITYVGKVNMDRNASEDLCEVSVEQSTKDTKDFIREASGRYQRTKPILTPRFIPSCTDELMRELKKLQYKYSVPMQSHLSENLGEVTWVKELVPTASSYAAAYDDFGLFGREVPTIMAHCVYNTPEEIALMKENKVYVAHCPESNLNLASGIAPIRNYIRQNLNIGLGTDVAGGSSLSLLKAMAHAIQASKLYWRLMDQTMEPLTFAEVFYLASLGGGSFFGKVGSFLEGYEFDAVVLDDSKIKSVRPCYGIERVERLMYLSEGYQVYEKYVRGRKIL